MHIKTTSNVMFKLMGVRYVPGLKTVRMPKKEKLELVHSDVWGPVPVPLLVGSRYYVTFIDDSTLKVWVYLHKNKSDVFMTFKKWKSQVELDSSCKVKCLQTNNSGE